MVSTSYRHLTGATFPKNGTQSQLLEDYNTNPTKKMRLCTRVKPFFAITYKANNAQGIIPFGINYLLCTLYASLRLKNLRAFSCRASRPPGYNHIENHVQFLRKAK